MEKEDEHTLELFCLAHWTLLPPSPIGEEMVGVGGCGVPHTEDLKQPLQFPTNKFLKRKLALTPQGRN